MADTEKTIVYGVKLDLTDLTSKQKQLETAIAQVRAEQTNLSASTEEGRKQFAENGKQLKVLEAQLKINQKQLGALTEAEKANTDTTNFANNSIKQNRELLKTLTAEYIHIQNPTKEQTANVKNLTDKLKEQESAIGDNRRNVGNYAESLKGALSQGLKAGISGINGLSGALTASPIGLVTQAVQLLAGAFGGIQPVVDFLEQKIAALTAAFKFIVGGIGGFIGSLVSGEGVTEAYSKNIAGLGENISAAAVEANNLTKAIQDLEDAQSEALVTTAKNNQAISNLIIQSKNRTLSEQERLKLLDEASKLETENFNIELSNAQERERISNAELAAKRKAREDDGEALKAARQATADRINLETSSANLQETIANRRSLLIQNETTERQTAADKAKAIRDKEQDEEDKRIKESIERRKKDAADRALIEQQLRSIVQGIKDKEEEDRVVQQEKEIAERDLAAQRRAEEYALYLENLQLEQTDFETAQELKLQTLRDANAKAVADVTLGEEKKKNIILKNNKAILAIETETAKARIGAYDAVANVINGLSEILGQQSEVGKALAIAATTISTYTAAQKAYESVIGIPFVGTALAPIAAGVAIAQGLLRVQQIQKVKVSGFAGGGFTGSGFGSPDASGFKPAGIVHENEYVVPKSVVYNPVAIPHIRALESMRMKRYADGGLVTQQNGNFNMIDFIEAMKNMNLVVSVEEINQVQSRLKLMETVATL